MSIKRITISVPVATASRIKKAAGARTTATALRKRAELLGSMQVEIADLYDGGRSWSDLQFDAGIVLPAPGPQEEVLRRACGRLLHVDDRERIDGYLTLLALDAPPDLSALPERERRLLRMLVAALADKAVTKATSLAEACALLWAHPQVRFEVIEILRVLKERIDHLHSPLRTHPDVPLQVHGRYSRLEILAAFGIGEGAKVAPWQTGVYWAERARSDLLAFTLDKTSGQFSPTTRYRDYAISRDLIHWESQSVTRADSETGRRYRTHAQTGSTVQLFARLRSDDRAFWFLGPASYVKHESELPMAVTWQLEHSLPGDLFATFAAAVA